MTDEQKSTFFEFVVKIVVIAAIVVGITIGIITLYQIGEKIFL